LGAPLSVLGVEVRGVVLEAGEGDAQLLDFAAGNVVPLAQLDQRRGGVTHRLAAGLQPLLPGADALLAPFGEGEGVGELPLGGGDGRLEFGAPRRVAGGLLLPAGDLATRCLALAFEARGLLVERAEALGEHVELTATAG